jgi:hypothetical protein
MDLLSHHQRRMVHLLRPVIRMGRRQVLELHQRPQKSNTTVGSQYLASFRRYRLILMVHHLVEELRLVPHHLLQVVYTVPHQVTNMDPHPRQVTHMVPRLEDYPVTNMDHRHHSHRAPLMELLVMPMGRQALEGCHLLRAVPMARHQAQDLWGSS